MHCRQSPLDVSFTKGSPEVRRLQGGDPPLRFPQTTLNLDPPAGEAM